MESPTRLLLPLVAALTAAPLVAQTPAEPDDNRIPVLVLGVYHFANPNLDLQKTDVDDHLSPRRQAEIEAVTELLAKFEPTRIGVEVVAGSPHLARDYASYVAGDRELEVNEAEQLGMRLAKRLGHAEIFGIDHRMELDLDAVFAAATASGQNEVLHATRTAMAEVGQLQSRIEKLPVAEALRAMNDPALIPAGRDIYLRLVSVRDGETDVGAEQVGRWYLRNFRMFANLAAMARSPGDRVLVIVGLGHCPLLRDLVEAHPRMRLVDPRDYLPAK